MKLYKIRTQNERLKKMAFVKTEDRLAYKNLAFIYACLGEEYKKRLYSAAEKLFYMGTSMCSRERVHSSIDNFVEEISKDADLSETLKADLWQAFRLVAIDGLELRQDPDLTYNQLEESRDYLAKMCR